MTLQNIDDDDVPGTIYLVDVDHVSSQRHNADGNGDIILVPKPSSDPNDPLNWAPRRKLLHLVCIMLFTFFNGMSLSVVYSVAVPLTKHLDITLSDINAGTGYMFLLLGWSLLFWQPFALQYGKRVTYLISILGCVAMSMWSPYSHGQGQWYARNIVTGFLASPIEALPETSITDLYFAHERGTYMGWYAWTLTTSNYFAPVICGFINDGLGYKWPFFMQAIFCGATFFFLFFFMEETNYTRKHVDEPFEPNSPKAVAVEEKDNRNAPNLEPQAEPKSFWQRLAILDPEWRSRPFLMHWRAWQSVKFLSWPTIFYAGFSYGTYLIWFNILNATASLILSAEPYNFKPSFVGLSYMSCNIGVVIGAAYTGIFSDWFIIRAARRNKGTYEPEQRLWLYTAMLFLVPCALILWGVGAAHQIPWPGLLFAMLLLAICSTSGISMSISYMVDSFRDISGDALSTVIIVRNTMSFAIGYAITPWIESLGLQNCFISVAFVGLAIVSTYLVVIRFGKSWRRSKKEAYREEARIRKENNSQ